MTFAAEYGWVNLVLPFLGLAALAVLVPSVLARLMPETVFGLAVAAIGSAVVLAGLSASFLLWSYWSAGVFGVARQAIQASFGAALVWAPIAASVLLQHPRRWRPDLE